MKTIVLIALLGCGIAIQSVQAQNTGFNNAGMMYDPTFWKHNLRLSKEQYAAITEVNSKFYNNLIFAVQEVTSSKETISLTLLNQRKEQILAVLSSRQKSKWKKISRSYN